DAAAGRRIGAVRLCADQPGARERLRDGSLTLSAAAELQWAFDRQRRRGSIAGIASTVPAGSAPASGAVGSAPAEAARAGRNGEPLRARAAAGARCGRTTEAGRGGGRQERAAGPPHAG
ncbi:MAG: hypothetical protein OXJ90_02475, partial [Spirochaetaceae bacterium]|nr:hypothetical protein [Spirochaetaceae bacterium]